MDHTNPNSQSLFLGLDCSTQSLKAVAINSDLTPFPGEWNVHYDTDLPGYHTEGGVHRGPDGLTVTAPPLMWAAALDRLFDRMRKSGFPFELVAAISGSGQQHGSVYWRKGAQRLLRRLNPDLPLRDQLASAFVMDESPIWMDSSTTAQCRALEKALGGPQAVAELTGSRAYERFTGNQIAKISQMWPERYAQTERIALVSSFMASLLIGDYAPIDVSDGSGMNLMDIRQRVWAPAALKATAPALEKKLGSLTLSHRVIGTVHNYFVRRYGFSSNCVAVAFSGDNPNSLAGLLLRESGDVAISLGTSDTLFASLREPKPSASEGHILASPIEPDGYMALICYKNGSLTREDVRNSVAARSWTRFSELLRAAPPGNGGHIGFFIKEPEITPPILRTGIHRFGPDDTPRSAFSPETEARAVVEGQFLSMRLHAERIGICARSILATGGASANSDILRVMADVFGVPVHAGDQPNSAALGAAYRARHGWECHRGSFVPFSEVVAKPVDFATVITPNPAITALYEPMLRRYAALEERLLN